ncbi:NAD(P)-binding domain-containing protein [Bogoriella caseilytica]|uniref:Uncharacterized protein n=1 Tax=Bogoriella caseilytica TaxID=56055 RepID=A0A3N2BDJ0_9MICO|nr:NAD(P)-binding domain-containing protein [Bogoriella caseilytica]ROR73323.1 hypothetical protein EDD31_1700 [Bogoriella caseilytica]
MHVRSADGEYRMDARAVIDASGTWQSPNSPGAGGLPALGEKQAGDVLSYRIPDFRDRQGFEGQHTVVIGSGHSAVTALLALARMARRDLSTTVTWVPRRVELALPDTGVCGGSVIFDEPEPVAVGRAPESIPGRLR